jgi:hypothetical protein
MSVANLACRSCGATRLSHILSLGHTPLANALLDKDQLRESEPLYPLELVFCSRCTLVQITETVPPEELFGEYPYFSSSSDVMLQHAKELAARSIRAYRLNHKSLVAEAASNDGYLLQYYKEANIPVLGIEPAVNVARVAKEERGILTLHEFFGEPLARQLTERGEKADVVHANNVLAHVTELNGFVCGLRLLLKYDGVAIVEVPYVKEMIDQREFDTIYHEHLCYFSLTALNNLFERHGLSIEDVEQIPIHGGSLRVFVGNKGIRPQEDRPPSVARLLQEEKEWGVEQEDFYRGLDAEVERLRDELVSLLRDLKARGETIAVYGASAKGSTLLNYFGIGKETLDFVVDRSTVKQGHYTPGTHLPIYAPEKLSEVMPAYVLLLTWNFAEEIMAQQKAYRRRGGHFIIPIPEVEVV